MLRDEESGQWDGFDADAGEVSLNGRGGRGIWDGFGVGNSGPSGTMKSERSFLGGALGGFVAVGSEDRNEEEEDEFERRRRGNGGGEADVPMLAPIEEWDETEDNHSNDHSMESSGLRSIATTSTGPTTSTAPSSACYPTPPRAAHTPLPALYGSSFNSPHQPSSILSPSSTMRSVSRSSSTNSDPHGGVVSRSNSNWFRRLALLNPRGTNGTNVDRPSTETPTLTANEPLRDPTPAPSLGHLSDPKAGYLDPFADPFTSSSSPTPLALSNKVNELGSLAYNTSSRSRDGNRSLSSNASDVTASSSMLEERIRGYDVVQRGADGSMSTLSRASSMMHGGGGSEESAGTFGRLPSEVGSSTEDQDSFDDSMEMVADRRKSRYESAQATLVPSPVQTMSISRFASPAPSLADSTTFPPSARRSPVGPRPQPPLLSPLIIPPSVPPKSSTPNTAGTTGVRAMVQQLEQRSASMDNLSKIASPVVQKVVEKERERRGSRTGMARKPVLFVANPDA